jgi:low affinity Fe/Cu permease
MNYTTLVANIQNFLEDDSTELQASIDEIINQAEDMRDYLISHVLGRLQLLI